MYITSWDGGISNLGTIEECGTSSNLGTIEESGTSNQVKGIIFAISVRFSLTLKLVETYIETYRCLSVKYRI